MNSVGPPCLNPLVNYYDGPEVPLEEIESHLLKFTGGSIDLEKRNSGIATMCINHYEKRNAISGKMMVDLRRAVDELEQWREGKGVIVFGRGGTFCSGGDLDMARRTSNAADAFKMSAYMSHVLLRLQRLPLLSVALIEGSAPEGAEDAAEGDGTLAAAEAWLRERTHAPPEVLRALKTMCDAPVLGAGALDERRIFAPLWGAPHNRQALARRLRHTTAPDRTTP